MFLLFVALCRQAVSLSPFFPIMAITAPVQVDIDIPTSPCRFPHNEA